jgi:hypothetical protein
MHYQYLEIGRSLAIHEIATTEARHDRHTTVRHTRNRHASCGSGSGCIPLAVASGDLLADAASYGTPDCATHGTGQGHCHLGASVQLSSMKARYGEWTG